MKHITTVFSLCLAFLSGCGQNSGFLVNGGNLAATEKSDDRPDAVWDKTKHGEVWTKATSDAIDKYGTALIKTVPNDIKEWCPKFAGLDDDDRKAFWIDFISAMAEKESSMDEDMRYKESFNDSTNTRVISRGLLQLSKESANGYGCNIDVGSELETAHTNLTCGVRILNHWIEHDMVVQGGEKGAWRGGARFWAVLRTKDSRDYIQKSVLSLDICN